jgi:predicted RNA-binding Zn-ribbon protein involved in translation (DUF1610 family)
MSKITFRADDALVETIESFDESKSEVMRKALRQYLETHPETDVGLDRGSVVNTPKHVDYGGESIDGLIVSRIDELLEDRIDTYTTRRTQPRDVNVNITLDGDSSASADVTEDGRKTNDGPAAPSSNRGGTACSQCGENVTADHVYCPNCGEKASHRSFCDCGTELGSDWAFCPGCGRRTPAADVLDR